MNQNQLKTITGLVSYCHADVTFERMTVVAEVLRDLADEIERQLESAN